MIHCFIELAGPWLRFSFLSYFFWLTSFRLDGAEFPAAVGGAARWGVGVARSFA